jgi:hypothetical protein
VKELAELLNYDPETGAFTWKVKAHRGAKIGARAGTVKKPEGYRRIRWRGKVYYEHRLAWLMMTGEAPQQIDHKDANRTNNKFNNLRAATDALNQENRRTARSDSGSGLIGAMRNKRGFMARIQVRGAMHHLGTFADAETAHAKYVAAKRQLHEGNTL